MVATARWVDGVSEMAIASRLAGRIIYIFLERMHVKPKSSNRQYDDVNTHERFNKEFMSGFHFIKLQKAPSQRCLATPISVSRYDR